MSDPIWANPAGPHRNEPTRPETPVSGVGTGPEDWPEAPSFAGPAGANSQPGQSPSEEPAYDGPDEPVLEMPASLWEKLKGDPQYAPEYIAIEAVKRLGPQAHNWVTSVRRLQPGTSPDGLADLVVRRFVNRARLSGAVSGLTGLPGAVVDVGVLAWTQASMVLHLAAVYGQDPTDQQRAADLLVLQKVHKYLQGARTALDVAAGRTSMAELMSRRQRPLVQVFVQLGIKLAQMAGLRAAKRMFAKVVPGAGVILGTWANSAATKELAARTIGMYRKQMLPFGPGGGMLPPSGGMLPPGGR